MRTKKLVEDLQMKDKQIDLLKKMITKAKDKSSSNGSLSFESEEADLKGKPTTNSLGKTSDDTNVGGHIYK